MATGYLTLNTTQVSATSSWDVYKDASGVNHYGSPSTGYGYINVSVPSSMTGATFNSVSLTKNNVGGNGYKTIRFNSNGDEATNGAILTRLRNGTNLNLEFRFVSNGGWGNPSGLIRPETFSETTTWSNVKILVDYTPPGKMGKSVTVTNCGTCEIRLNDVSMAAGESGTATLLATPSKAITKIVAKVRVGTSGHVETYTINKSISANNTSSASFTLAPLAAWFPTPGDRVNDTYVQFVFTSGGTDYSSSWTKLTDATYGDFELLRERAVPVIYDVQFSETTPPNLFNKTAKASNNGYIESAYLSTGGAIVNNDPDLDVSEYIVVKPNTTYTATPVSGTNVYLCWYNNNHEYLGGQAASTSWGTFTSTTFTTPNNAAYVRLSVAKQKINETLLYSDAVTHISTYGNPIAGKTYLNVSFNVTLDTSADAGISQSNALFTIDNVSYTPSNNECSLQPVASSGSVGYTISVTDSYGQTGTLNGTQTFLAYNAPTMTDVSVGRYTTAIDGQGNPIYVDSDDSSSVWLNAGITVQSNLGTKNLFNKNATDVNNGYISGQYIQSNGVPTTPSSSATIQWAVSEYIPVVGGNDYTISGLPTSGASLPSVCWYTSTKTYINGSKYNNTASVTVTMPSTAAFVRISVPDTQIDQLQLEAGSSATTYSPYLCANTWTLAYTMDGGQSTNIYTDQTTLGITLEDAVGLINDTVSASDDHTFVLTLSDQFTSLVETFVVSKAGAIFDIEPGGVAVGMRCTGTEAGGEKFQVAYPTELLGDTSITNLTNLNGRVYDTGWVNMSAYVKPSLCTIGSEGFYLRRVGNVVFTKLSVNLVGTLNASTWLDFSQTSGGVQIPLPQEWWPQQLAYLPGFSQTPGGWIAITTDGYLRLRNQTGAQVKGTSSGGSWWCHGVGCYPVA